jgi:hypothetical protein
MSTKQIGAKIPLQAAAKLAEIAENKGLTMSDVIKNAVDNFLNPPKPPEYSPEIMAENARLKENLRLYHDRLEEYQARNEELANAEPQTIEVIKETPIELQKNQIIVTLNPVQLHFLEKTKQLTEKQTNKPTTYESILKGLFIAYVKDGPGDHLPINISNREFRTVTEHYKAAQTHE